MTYDYSISYLTNVLLSYIIEKKEVIIVASKFSTNVEGKVSEIRLDSKKGYQALFEVISNSIYSINNSGISDGAIYISLKRNYQIQEQINVTHDELRKKSKIRSITITDNGVGFNSENFNSFLTCYSDYKKNYGGKGVGRFTCLKVFNYVSVKSVYDEDERKEITFNFYPENELRDERINKVTCDKKTTITLHDIKSKYEDEFPTDLNVLSDLIIEHFFVNFITNTMPSITISDEVNGTININEYYKDSSDYNIDIDTFYINTEKFTIHHIKSSSINKTNKLYLCADNRNVESLDLRNIIHNLQSYVSNVDGVKKWYFAYIESDYLNKIVNSERTNLDFPDVDCEKLASIDISKETLVSHIRENITKYLKKELDEIDKLKKQKIDNYIDTKAPKYKILKNCVPEFYNEVPNKNSDDSIDSALYKIYKDYEKSVYEQGKKLFDESKNYSADEIYKLKKAYLDGASNLGKSSLIDYVIHRKAVLDIFNNALSSDVSTQKYKLEEVVHKLICPMIASSDELSYDDMNLWLIDEKLSYHYYLASDLPFKKQKPISCDSAKESDLIVYENSMAFSNAPSDMPFNALTIIEFKRPMRNDYNDNENPIKQVKMYIDELRKGKAIDRSGRPISGHMENLPIYVYIIADIRDKLQKICDSEDFIETPDKEGYYKYHSHYKAYIEIMSYKKLYTNAQQRNKILFDKLFKQT